MTINREQALEILHKNMQNQNLRRHCYAVEAAMRALGRRLGGDEEKWGIIGLLHDADYEKTKELPERHTRLTVEWLEAAGETDPEIISAILSHNYAHTEENPPKNDMEWALYCSDELTGFIVAVALVRPDKRLASVTIESIMKKWDEKSFAAGVHREQIEECEERLGIPLQEFIGIVLEAMQGVAEDLGL